MLPRAKTTKHNKQIGAEGEERAAQYLGSLGYTILDRNFRTRYGEVDIIATKDNVLYCVEVKTRLSNRFGTALDAITPHKLQKMYLMAEIVMKMRHANNTETKLCVVTVDQNGCTLFQL